MASPTFALLLLCSLACVAHTGAGANSTDATNTTLPSEVNLQDNVQERSLGDLPRQGRIINDDKISIKGFIPIVGLGEESVKEKDKTDNIDKYLKSLAAMTASTDQRNPMDNYASSYPQHMAQPEDQRYIGAALQGLLGNVGSIRKAGFASLKPGITRKSDCVCVPFYMCKNGHLVESQSQSALGDLSSMYSMYEQQRRHEPSDPHPYKAHNEDYLPINERSNDNINETKFTEEILGRMLGGKSMSDGCGLLRTCCQRASPTQMIPTEFASNVDYGQMLPELSTMYKPPQSAYLPYRPNSYHKPQDNFSPTMRPYPPRPYRPAKLVNSPSYLEPMIEAPLPLPVRNDQLFSESIGNFAYDKCGSRQSVGINGRVQNLNYHESSTEFGEFPWQVAILKKLGPSDNLYACGGALITSNFILTAAHCIKKYQAHDFKIRLGEWDVHREDEFYPYIEKNVEEIIVHPHFSPRNLANDVAILRLESELDFSQHPHISPICMAQPFEVFAGHRCYVSGWGKNAFGQKGEYQSVLMKVDLPVLDTRQCENMLRRTKLGYGFRLDRSMICAGGEAGKDACEGDGGSGLVCELNGTWKVAGLVSWGLGCGQAAVPGVYTNIAHMRAWVDKVVFPYYATVMHSKAADKNLNELISERSLEGATNSSLPASPANKTLTSL